MQRILPMRDIMAMDEPLPSFRQCAHRLCCFFHHSKTAEVLQLESVEKGALLADEVIGYKIFWKNRFIFLFSYFETIMCGSRYKETSFKEVFTSFLLFSANTMTCFMIQTRTWTESIFPRSSVRQPRGNNLLTPR